MAGAGGPQIRQGIVATIGDREQMIDIGGGCAAMDADSAVAGEHLATDRLPTSPPRSPELLERMATTVNGGETT